MPQPPSRSLPEAIAAAVDADDPYPELSAYCNPQWSHPSGRNRRQLTPATLKIRGRTVAVVEDMGYTHARLYAWRTHGDDVPQSGNGNFTQPIIAMTEAQRWIERHFQTIVKEGRHLAKHMDRPGHASPARQTCRDGAPPGSPRSLIETIALTKTSLTALKTQEPPHR